MSATTSQKLGAETLGTFVLVFGGCGAAVLAGEFIGFAGVALAFGLTVLCMAYAVGHISGGHFNPAVSVGLAAAGRFAWKDLPMYVGAQVIGAFVAASALYAIASGIDDFDASAGFASNGYGDLSPNGYSLLAALICEIVLTAVFLYIILGATDRRAPAGFAPVAIGLGLTLIHLVSIPVTNTSVNPARSIAPALFAGGDYIGQLWLFIVAPVVGALVAGLSYALILGDEK
jgi:aquaporin Z